MRKFACIIDSKVVSVKSLLEEEVSAAALLCDNLIDIEDLFPQPSENWKLEGSVLIAFEAISPEKLEIELATKKVEIGAKIAQMAVIKVGARNRFLGKTGSEVVQMLTALSGIKALLETGALSTARGVSFAIKGSYPDYVDIFNDTINLINDFEGKYGL